MSLLDLSVHNAMVTILNHEEGFNVEGIEHQSLQRHSLRTPRRSPLPQSHVPLNRTSPDTLPPGSLLELSAMLLEFCLIVFSASQYESQTRLG